MSSIQHALRLISGLGASTSTACPSLGLLSASESPRAAASLYFAFARMSSNIGKGPASVLGEEGMKKWRQGEVAEYPAEQGKTAESCTLGVAEPGCEPSMLCRDGPRPLAPATRPSHGDSSRGHAGCSGALEPATS